MARSVADGGQLAKKPSPRRSVFGGEQDCAGILGARPQALHHAQQQKHDRCRNADRTIGGQQADRRGAEPHQQQRGNQHRLAASTCRRSGRTARRQTGARDSPPRTWRRTQVSPPADHSWGRTPCSARVPRRCRRGRNRTIPRSCRWCWHRPPASGSYAPPRSPRAACWLFSLRVGRLSPGPLRSFAGWSSGWRAPSGISKKRRLRPFWFS